jgi:hypothetical protein
LSKLKYVIMILYIWLWNAFKSKIFIAHYSRKNLYVLFLDGKWSKKVLVEMEI